MTRRRRAGRRLRGRAERGGLCRLGAKPTTSSSAPSPPRRARGATPRETEARRPVAETQRDAMRGRRAGGARGARWRRRGRRRRRAARGCQRDAPPRLCRTSSGWRTSFVGGGERAREGVARGGGGRASACAPPRRARARDPEEKRVGEGPRVGGAAAASPSAARARGGAASARRATPRGRSAATDAWTQLDGVTKVFERAVGQASADQGALVREREAFKQTMEKAKESVLAAEKRALVARRRRRRGSRTAAVEETSARRRRRRRGRPRAPKKAEERAAEWAAAHTHTHRDARAPRRRAD